MLDKLRAPLSRRVLWTVAGIPLSLVAILILALVFTGSDEADPSVKKAVQSEAEYKNLCREYTHESIVRNAESNKKNPIKFTGRVKKVSTRVYTVYTTAGEHDWWSDDPFYVKFSGSSNRGEIMDGDHITVYGDFIGMKSLLDIVKEGILFGVVFGTTNESPYVTAKYVDLVSTKAERDKQAEKEKQDMVVHFNAITDGMSYAEVVKIIGSDGLLSSESANGYFNHKTYEWSSTSPYWSVTITFSDNKVMNKIQYGLT